MSLSLRLFALVFILILFAFLTYLICKKKLTIKYALIWYITDFVLALFVCIPQLLNRITHILGFEIASNMILCLFVVMNILISIYLTTICEELSKKIRTLTQEISLLKAKVEKEDKN